MVWKGCARHQVFKLSPQLMPFEAGRPVMGPYGVTARVCSDNAVADRPDRGTGAKWAFTLSSSQSRANQIYSPTGALLIVAELPEYVCRLDPCAVYRLHGRRARMSQRVLKEQSAPD